ncbi:MAG: hypothetical protein ACPGWR_26130 [Ardenticatenaceae bacterium]
MPIPTYFQEINRFGSPNGHPNVADFIAEGLTEIDAATGHPIWNAAGQAATLEMISTRFSLAVELYHFIRDLESKLSGPQTTRQIVARGYYAMFWAGRALSLTLCDRDWGMGSGNHGNLPTHLDIHTTGDSWHPNFHRSLKKWRSLRNCADYNLFPILVYSGRYAGRRPRGVGSDYDSLNDAAFDVGNSVEKYLRESQRLITARGVSLVSIS